MHSFLSFRLGQRLAFGLFLLAAAPTPGSGAEPNPADAKLRETLRTTMLQLRTMQSERETVEAEKAQLQQEKDALAARLETATKEAAEEQDAASKRIAALETKTSSQELEVARLSEALGRWKASQQEATALAQNKEAARARLVQEKIELQRQVADQQTKNRALYKVGSEILARYEGFGLGTALSAREPFIGTTRVKMENLVQDYGDRLNEQRIAPPAAPSTAEKPEPPTKKPRTGSQTTSPTASPRDIGTKPIGESGQPARSAR